MQGLLTMAWLCTGDAVHCYICNSGDLYEGDDCKDPVGKEETLLKDCDLEGIKDSLNYTMCRKMVQDGKLLPPAPHITPSLPLPTSPTPSCSPHHPKSAPSHLSRSLLLPTPPPSHLN